MTVVEKISSGLSARSARTLDAAGFKPAAVLVPIEERAEEPHLVLTQRAAGLNSHGGQIAFPGGRIEARDSGPLEAALRESWEEIGVEPADVRVIGRLDQVTAASDYLVTPFVGVIPHPYNFRLNTDEAAALFSVPLRALAAEGCLKVEPRRFPPERRDPIYHFYYQEWDIWGATARIILQLLDVAYGFKVRQQATGNRR